MTDSDLNPATDPAGSAGRRRPGRRPAGGSAPLAMAGVPAYAPGAGAPPRRQPGARVLARVSATPLIGGLFLLGMVVCTVIIVLDAAAAKSPLVPIQPHIAGYLNGVGSMLDFKTFLLAVLAFSACYAGAVWCSRVLSPRVAVGAIVALHVIVFAGPILLSQDVFQYIDYGRLGVLHGLNPYQHGPAAAPHDAVFRYVGEVWHNTPAAYGPLFTLMSYPLAWLGVVGAVWAFKLLGVAASLATVGFVWLCARRLGRNPVPPALIVGVNPLLIIYGVGGFHNDLLMTALMMAGVWLALGGHDVRGGAAIIASGAIKATSVAVLPFMLLGRRRLSLITGVVLGLAVIALISLIAFGVHGLDFVSVLRRNSSFVSTDSFPNEIAHMLGFPGVFPIDRTLYRLATIAAILWLMWRTWRGYDWVSASSWTLLVLAVSATWLLAWYLLWALPMAVLARDRRVLWATMIIGALFIAHQTAPLFSPT
jgi:hypothetical protein